MMKQQLVYWPPAGKDMFGKPVWGTAVQLACRWEDDNDEMLTPEGERVISSAKVFVAQDVLYSGVLLLLNQNETINSLLDQTNPWNNIDGSGVARPRRIIRFSKLPDLKNRQTLRTAYVN